MDVIRYVSQGGFMMFPLFVCSVFLVTIIIDRLIQLQEEKIAPSALCQLLYHQENTEDISEQIRLYPSALATILTSLHKNRGEESSVQNRLLATFLNKEVYLLEKGLEGLSIIAAVAPLLGLLGTVLGMVDVFNTIVNQGVGQASVFSSGISKALLTTIGGLMVAVPALVAYGIFSRKVDSLIHLLDTNCQRYILKLKPLYVK